MKSICIQSDLTLNSKNTEMSIISNSEEIAVAIYGTGIPELGIPLRKMAKWVKMNPYKTNQLITISFNRKEVYKSNKSIFKRYNLPFWVRFLVRNW